jgi:hypothetical protein
MKKAARRESLAHAEKYMAQVGDIARLFLVAGGVPLPIAATRSTTFASFAASRPMPRPIMCPT